MYDIILFSVGHCHQSINFKVVQTLSSYLQDKDEWNVYVNKCVKAKAQI